MDAESLFLLLKLTKEPANSGALHRDAQLEVLAALLKHLDSVEILSQILDDSEAVKLGTQVLDQVAKTNRGLIVNICLILQVVTEPLKPDLVQNELVKLRRSELLNGVFKDNLGLQIVAEAILPRHLLEAGLLRLFHFDLDLVADTKLVLDMLSASHAAENATANHDSKLRGERLSFLHRVGGQDYCRALVSLRNLLYDLPHEAASFWIHTCRRFIEQDDRRITHEGHSN